MEKLLSLRKVDNIMNCLGCNNLDWEYPDASIARCKNRGYLLDPYVFGMKQDFPSVGSKKRSEQSLWLAKIVLGVSLLLLIVSIWIPDWAGISVIGFAVSVILWIDHVLYL